MCVGKNVLCELSVGKTCLWALSVQMGARVDGSSLLYVRTGCEDGFCAIRV